MMNRRDWVKLAGFAGAGLLVSGYKRNEYLSMKKYEEKADWRFDLAMPDFGCQFKWGVAAAAYQTEGAWNEEGKGESVWDHFSRKAGKIERDENANIAADFYHRYEEDIDLIKAMNFGVFRFSLSWPRILPHGVGEVNKAGIDFYHRVIDKCLAVGIEPWVTIYHWDLPQALEEQGGWTNRQILEWFAAYVEVVTSEFGSKVKNWMVLNEQFSFIAGGYLAGNLAPGRRSLSGFLKAAHYSVLCNAEGGRIIRKNIPDANVGTTFFTAYIEPVDSDPKNEAAARRVDAGINRMFIEPALGLGYPVNDLPVLKKIYKYMEPGDEARMAFDFDFVGIQYYFRAVVEKSVIPYVRAREISAGDRGVPLNEMGYEIYPEGLYRVLKKFSGYTGVKNLIITENGVCTLDKIENDSVHDTERIGYFKDHLQMVHRAIRDNIHVTGYFVWSPTDNFEWDKGFRTRFGLVYVDFATLKRTMKDSGIWFHNFLK